MCKLSIFAILFSCVFFSCTKDNTTTSNNSNKVNISKDPETKSETFSIPSPESSPDIDETKKVYLTDKDIPKKIKPNSYGVITSEDGHTAYFNDQGNIIKQTRPDGSAIHYTYDRDGKLLFTK